MYLTHSSSALSQVWQLGSSAPNFTLEGHEKGVNCIDYYSGGDKPYLISGADDRLVKIWDYQVRRLRSETNTFSLRMPVTCSADGFSGL